VEKYGRLFRLDNLRAAVVIRDFVVHTGAVTGP
jgi:hypothetical protein